MRTFCSVLLVTIIAKISVCYQKKNGCKLPVTVFVFGCLVFISSLSNPLEETRLPAISRFDQVV